MMVRITKATTIVNIRKRSAMAASCRAAAGCVWLDFVQGLLGLCFGGASHSKLSKFGLWI